MRPNSRGRIGADQFYEIRAANDRRELNASFRLSVVSDRQRCRGTSHCGTGYRGKTQEREILRRSARAEDGK